MLRWRRKRQRSAAKRRSRSKSAAFCSIWKPKSCVLRFWTANLASTAVISASCVRFRSAPAYCLARMAPHCLRAEKRKLWWLPRWEPRAMNRRSLRRWASTATVSCCTIICRLSPPVKPAVSARRRAVRSAMDAWPSARWWRRCPRLRTIRSNPQKIRDVIGKGGAVIRALTEETGTQIDISDEGVVTIASVDASAGQEAKRRIEELTASVEVGKIYDGVVLKLLDFGAIVQVLPGKDGLLHISQIANERVNAVADYLKEGQQVRVKVLETDERGRLKLSMKAASVEDTVEAGEQASQLPIRDLSD